MEVLSWLFFLPQLPSFPSSLRVQVWRRMRAAGALGLQNGLWILPWAPAHEQNLRELLAYVERHGGTGLLFRAAPLDAAVNARIIERFRADRAQEYTEFGQRCADLLAELAKESQVANFSFAELEENEQDLQKLEEWLRKIQARDFFGGYQAEAARLALHAFTQALYPREGLTLHAHETDGVAM